MNDIFKNIIKGVISGSFGVIISLVIQLLSLPLFIHYWGMDRYGEWLIIYALPFYLSISDFGLVNVYVNKAGAFFAIKRLKLVQVYFTTALYTLIPIGMFIGILILSINVNMIDKKSIFICSFLLVVYSFCSFFNNFICNFFRATRKFHIGSYLLNITRLLDFVVTVITLAFHGDEVELAIVLVVCKFLSVLISFLLFKKINKWCSFDFKFYSNKLFKLNIIKSISYFLIPLSQMTINQGLMFSIGITIGADKVVIFNSVRVFCRLLLLMTNVLTAACRQEINRAYFLLAYSDFYRIIAKLKKTNFILCFSIGFLMVFLGRDIILLWTSNKVDVSFSFILIIMIGVVFNSLSLVNLSILTSINKHNMIALLMAGIYFSITLLSFFVSSLSMIAYILLIGEVVIFIISYIIEKNLRLSCFEK
ncbi:TPA: hypothetical protein ACX6QF_003415 [Photobacterium damselae]